MVQIKWLISAKNDLHEIYEYISKDSIKYAKLQIQKIIGSTQIIKSNIYIGKIVLDFENRDIREIIEGSYRIIYKIIDKNQIHILFVHHSSRDLLLRNSLI
jgi:toxin ParE1/3/4